MKPYVFVSYSHVDADLADLLAKDLVEVGAECFLDRKEIRWGENITSVVRDALRRSTHHLMLLSPASIRSGWVHFETGHAFGAGKVTLPYLTHPSLEVPDYLHGHLWIADRGQLKDYFRLECERLSRVDAEPPPVSATKLLIRSYPETEVRQIIGSASHVALVGTTLAPTVHRYYDLFEALLANGKSLDVVVSKPTPEVLAMQIIRSSSIREIEPIRQLMESNLNTMLSLRKHVPPGKLDVRVIPYLYYGILLIDGADVEPVIYVKMMAFQRPDAEAPTYRIFKRHDPRWFAFYEHQLELLKAAGERVT